MSSAFENGCKFVATDNGAAQVGKKGSGTIPHALENIYAYYYEFNCCPAFIIKSFRAVCFLELLYECEQVRGVFARREKECQQRHGGDGWHGRRRS